LGTRRNVTGIKRGVLSNFANLDRLFAKIKRHKGKLALIEQERLFAELAKRQLA
jgi:hypothetical protein